MKFDTNLFADLTSRVGYFPLAKSNKNGVGHSLPLSAVADVNYSRSSTGNIAPLHLRGIRWKCSKNCHGIARGRTKAPHGTSRRALACAPDAKVCWFYFVLRLNKSCICSDKENVGASTPAHSRPISLTNGGNTSRRTGGPR